MPRSFDDYLDQATLPDTVTDADLDALKQEIVRDVTATLMFGARPAPEGHYPTALDRAEAALTALSTELIHSTDAAGYLARIADAPSDADGALHFGCLLNLAHEPDSALWWWQFAAGAGNATAAYCLHLYHLLRGELRDADHWAHQALNLDSDIHLASTTPWPARRPDHPAMALREAVERLKVEELAGAPFHHPDHRLADQIEELTDAC
ncbi:hypothetical protein [Streptomyces lancefieldiae]|uniref:Uncharacterized protein n=1 Tax=Streptomyces lancefieldiae TaxID=3075520 RepID=A0ABU3APQ0_9ACTN|nr:hypothetical protein [Streptomyces sp. DSM 40712]MDT0611068.1 hypothetical protein [Streptomyces sp. DSM 40712]